MEREEVSGISNEFNQELEQVAAENENLHIWEDHASSRGTKAWRQPSEEPKEKEENTVDILIVPEERENNRRREKKTRGREPEHTGLSRPSDGLLVAFFIPVIIMVVIFAQRGIFPFGQESFLRTDMYHQYAPFFSEFQHKLRGGGSLLYSWDIGLGVNFSALYAYYLASPLNWLLILCPKAYIIEFMTYSVVLKIGLSGLTFAYYLKKHNNRSDFGIGFFGVFYALSGYMAAYSWNIMWLDCILLFPLIVLGLEKLVKEKNALLYCITLGLSILSNYYISIMICAFMVIYFICLQILEGKRSGKECLIGLVQFGGYSLLAGGLAAAVLLPEVFALQSTASGDVNFPKTFEMYFSIFDMLSRHIGNVQTETGLDHWPNIFCGVAVFMFFLLYLFSRKIPVKEKVVYCGLLLLFFASFSVNVLNFMWHGFHYPNSLPARQSFIYIFLMLALCYRAYMYLKDTPKKHVAVAFWGSVCYILLAQKLVTDKAYHFSVFYAAILFLALYTGLIYWYKNPQKSKFAVAILALAVVALEAAVNTTVTSITTTSRTSYLADNENVAALTGNLASENGFYRVEKVSRKTKNDGAWMNFPSVSLFSSMAHADLTSFFKKMGCEGSTNAYSITGSTPLVDSLFSVKFALYGEAQDNPRLILNETVGDTYLYENPYTLPLGFMMPDAMETSWQMDMPNPIDVQNDLANTLLTPSMFSEVSGEAEGTVFSFTPERDGEYYVFIRNKKVKEVTVSKGEINQTVDNVNRGFLVELGFCQAEETITIKNKEGSEELNAGAWVFEEEGMRAVYETLNHSPFILNSWEDDKIEGTIEAADSGTAFFSIPYDRGWKILVDGHEVTPRKVLDAFIGVDLSAGRHTIVMHYMPEGLKLGAVISGVCIALLILATLCERLYKKKKAEKAPSPYDKLDEEWTGGNKGGESR